VRVADRIDRLLETVGLDERPHSPVRGARLTARVGVALGVCFAVCFVTGLLSHWIQHPPGWFVWPTSPSWLYRFTQGLHVTTGVAAIPLLLVKLGTVYPKLFARPRIGSPVRLLERASITVLVVAGIFQLFTGLMNIAQWYPWTFFFTTTHYATAWIAIGAVLVHIAVKLPVIRTALGEPLDAPEVLPDGTTAPTPGRPGHAGVLTRRTVLRSTWALTGLAAVAVVGQSLPFARWISFLAPRSGEGPQGLPVNRTAQQAGITDGVRGADYRLILAVSGREVPLTLDDLRGMPQTTRDLPIACVEGWSASATWTGVRLRDLLARAGHDGGRDTRMVSLDRGLYGVSVLPANFVDADDTLIALRVNDEELNLDHGFPCRLIAPNRPGVLQTKWLSRIEVL
jgi:DMSO/TMAO reductase YedYZ molybdopterin-dependent catalytic subunit